MKIYGISDLHLPGMDSKPMDIFGDHWQDHWNKIKDNWSEIVTGDDVVLIPGDISWAMKLEDAVADLEDIGSLPGKKILIRGNHDYWWSSISRIRRALPPNMYALQNDSISIYGITFCGTRGWIAPGSKGGTPHDLKIFNREISRLKLSLDSAKNSENIVVLLHYPPFDDKGQETELAELIRKYPVRHVVFGHLHGESLKGVTEGVICGLHYHLVSCDYLDFKLKPIMDI